MKIMTETTKKESEKKEVPVTDSGKEKITPKMRQIVIETDGNLINLISAEVSGRIELIAILQGLIAFLNQQNNGRQTDTR